MILGVPILKHFRVLVGSSMHKIMKIKASVRKSQKLKWTHPNNKDGQVHWSKKGLLLSENMILK